ncbi:hypothetical protein NBRC110019_20850 [Neptunitalea chrysea]|uniref:Uncharacterized protein n=1 Tax=Neptunitalea chrysea TaxID=1647581 RepID=A0A9W6EU51_9FLAO|nr:hypothetical protein [Neptunitalea chrysea]GLB53045.1 hypothetical protein NBRC110019_20850 [Neptunitalea chrysea]
MDQVKLLSLDIDVNKLLAKATEAEKNLKLLRADAEALKLELANGAQTIAQYNSMLVQLAAQAQYSTERFSVMKQELVLLNQQYANLHNALLKLNNTIILEVSSYKTSVQLLMAYNNALQTQASAVDSATGGMVIMNVEVTNLIKRYQVFVNEEQNLATAIEDTNTKLEAQTDNLKETGTALDEKKEKEESLADAIRSTVSVSNEFNESLEKEIALIPGVTTKLSLSADGLKKYAEKQKDAVKASKNTSAGLKRFKIALISTGIGVLIAALGMLASALQTSQQFTDAFNKVLAPLQGAFKGIILVIQDLASNIVNIAKGAFGQFKDNFTILKNSFLNGVDSMRLLWNKFTGDQEEVTEIQDRIKVRQQEITDAINRTVERGKAVVDKYKEYGKTITDAANNQAKINDLTVALEEKQNDMILTRDKLTHQINEQKKIAEDVNKTESERKAAAEKAYELSQKLVAEEKSLLQLKKEKKELEIKVNGTSREAQNELNQLKVEENNLTRKGNDLEETKSNKLKEISKSERKQLQKAKEAIIKADKEELELYEAKEGSKRKTLDETIVYENTVSAKRTNILKKELAIGKISQTKYNTEIENLKNEHDKNIVDATIKNTQDNIDLFIAQNQSKIDSETQLTEELVAEEEKRLKDIHTMQTVALEQQMKDGLISYKQFQIDKIALDNEYEEDRKELANSYEEQKEADKEKEKADAAAKHKAEYETSLAMETNEYDQKRLVENERYFQEQAELEKRYEKGELTKQQYDKISEKNSAEHSKIIKGIDAEEYNAKLDLAKETLGNVTTLLGENTAAGKAAGIAQATINTYQGISEVWKAPSSMPEPLNTISKVAATGVTLASGVAAVKKITSVKTPKAEQGAVFDIGGRRHSSGGTKFYGEDGTRFEAEQGEKMFVLSRRASAAVAPLLSSINQRYGGVSLSGTSSYLAAGGQVLRNASVGAGAQGVQIDYDALAGSIGESVAQANQNLPRPVVTVEDINIGQSSYAQVVGGANI